MMKLFSDNNKVRSALAATFGVHCYPIPNSTNKVTVLEEFLNSHGHAYADNKRFPERALFIDVDEKKGFIVSNSVVRA